MLQPLMKNEELVLLVTVTSWVAVVFIVWLPKSTAVGAMIGVAPVPFNVALAGALPLTEMVPLRGPVVVGVNVTLMVQLEETASEAGQLLVWEKSPVVEMPEIETGRSPVFVYVNTCDVLVVFCGWPAKVSVAGLNEAEMVNPVPLRNTVGGGVWKLP